MNRKSTEPQHSQSSSARHIQLRGVRQNNLKGFDLDLPLGKLIVVTGPSGSGKSSLAFQTLYAEGQRRYVETFSPYTRQFFDRMDKPRVDSIQGIPPAIAVEQVNQVRTTRSTVGTITEINDYLKLLYARLAQAYCPSCHQEVKPDHPAQIASEAATRFHQQNVTVAFPIPVPPKTHPRDFFPFLQSQGYLRVTLFGKVFRTDEADSCPYPSLPTEVLIIQDRVKLTEDNLSRFHEAIETAFRLGKGHANLMVEDAEGQLQYHAYSSGWHCATCNLDLRAPSPGLFSYNHPLGACPKCRGFGRVIGLDWNKVIPDKGLSIKQGLVKAFTGSTYSESQKDLIKAAEKKGISLTTPFRDLSSKDQEWILEGESMDPETAWDSGLWYGVRGFFRWLESNTYKMHVRVFLSHFRSYTECDACGGSRLQPEAHHFYLNGQKLGDLWKMPISILVSFFQELEAKTQAQEDAATTLVRREIQQRLQYLQQVGLGYLTLDRPTRDLSGGEVARVNLTTCLGASLTSTLFVLDEPTVGLHPRDTARLVSVLKELRDRGNTLVVVEHEESVMKAADFLVDIGPGSGCEGGQLTWASAPSELPQKEGVSLTADYLFGRKKIPSPAKRRNVKAWITIRGANANNLKNLTAKLPLGVLGVVTGVSGSGKSTLIHDCLYANLVQKFGDSQDEAAGEVRAIDNSELIQEVWLVDQSPVARTPRSTPAVYLGLFDDIRTLFADLPESKERGLTHGSFSFNSGKGRCQRCEGAGWEKIEMQFLSDVFVQCPECEGKRYTQALLEITLDGMSISDVLGMTVEEAHHFFSKATVHQKNQTKRILQALEVLMEVGLSYLTLGQPLNTLSGGENQRLKLVSHLVRPGASKGKGATNPDSGRARHRLFIFDEPTTGLHFDDIGKLLKVFHRLVDDGASLLVIEHHLDVIRHADFILDLGPEAGDQGGKVVATGTPKELAQNPESITGQFLQLDDQVAAPPFTLQESHESNVQEHTKAISITGAREHNLKNLTLQIPREQFVVITGLSGSGKSTLAFDLIFAEGQRRFLDSMSPYARQFAEQFEKPDVDHIAGLPPTVAIEQRVSQGGGKSTVATITEIWHFLRLLYSKLGTQWCPDCLIPVQKQSESAILETIRESSSKGSIRLLAPLVKGRKGFHQEIAEWAEKHAYHELWIDGQSVLTSEFKKLERFKEHFIDVVVAEIKREGHQYALRRPGAEKDFVTLKESELQEWVHQALKLGKGEVKLQPSSAKDRAKIKILSSKMACPQCDRGFEELDPRLFSYNSPHGWCPECRGYGQVKLKSTSLSLDQAESVLDAELREEAKWENLEESETVVCPRCQGSRLNEVARHVQLKKTWIEDFSNLTAKEAETKISTWAFEERESIISRDILPEIRQRLKFLEEVGLGYLQLNRGARTLSGGEAQRIRLAAQLGSNLRGVLYVLDEPTIGLHPRDNAMLLSTLRALQQKGNSLLVVEHDDETMKQADHLIDMGPGAGRFGGQIVAQGKPDDILHHSGSLTGKVLSEPMKHPLHGSWRKLPSKQDADSWLMVSGAQAHNLKKINVSIPKARLTVLTGVSGSGKSTLLRKIILPAAQAALKSEKNAELSTRKKPKNTQSTSESPWQKATGFETFTAVYEVDQSPIGKTSRSCPATYVGLFDSIRALFAALPESRVRGFDAGRFSFNTEGGRCETCKGNGRIKLEMAFLPPSWIHCEDCHGSRYNPATLEIQYRDKNIGEVMQMSVDEAAEFFQDHPKLARPLKLLAQTGLGYLQMGQPSPTLSGGEAQRLKLVTELTKGVSRSENALLKGGRNVKPNLYLIEEPTIGLHAEDVRRLIEVLHRLVDAGHTVIVIEHHLDLIMEADFLLDIGPEAGDRGGEIVAQGTVREVSKSKKSRTAPFLKSLL